MLNDTDVWIYEKMTHSLCPYHRQSHLNDQKTTHLIVIYNDKQASIVKFCTKVGDIKLIYISDNKHLLIILY